MMMNAAHGLAAAGVMIGSAALGGPVQERHVDSTANWMVHLDIEQAVATDLGRMLLGEIDKGIDEDPGMGELFEGLEWGEDLYGVTLYGSDGVNDDSSLVVMIAGSEKLELVGQRLSGAHEVYNGDIEIRIADHDVWRVGEDDEVINVLMIETGGDGRVLLASPDIGQLERGLSVLSGDRESIPRDTVARAAGEMRDGVILTVMATDVPGLIGFDPVSEIARKAEVLYAAIGQDGDEAFVAMSVKTEDESDAEAIVDVGQGLLALGRLISRDSGDAELEALMDLTRGLRIEADGRTVRCSLTLDTGTLAEILELASD